MDRPPLLGLDRARLVNRLTDDVDDAAERLIADRDHDRLAGVGDLLAAHEAFAGVHRDGAYRRLAEVLRHFEHQAIAAVRGFERVQDRGQVTIELHVDDSANDLGDLSDCVGGGGHFYSFHDSIVGQIDGEGNSGRSTLAFILSNISCIRTIEALISAMLSRIARMWSSASASRSSVQFITAPPPPR